jgi:hypothetical protein
VFLTSPVPKPLLLVLHAGVPARVSVPVHLLVPNPLSLHVSVSVFVPVSVITPILMPVFLLMCAPVPKPVSFLVPVHADIGEWLQGEGSGCA